MKIGNNYFSTMTNKLKQKLLGCDGVILQGIKNTF